jgi:hypothetical protein
LIKKKPSLISKVLLLSHTQFVFGAETRAVATLNTNCQEKVVKNKFCIINKGEDAFIFIHYRTTTLVKLPSLACDPTTVTDLQKTPAKVSLHSFSDLLQKTTGNGKIYICMQVQTGNWSFSLKDWNFNYATYEHTYTKATNPPNSTFACSPPSTTFASCTACVPSSQFV